MENEMQILLCHSCRGRDKDNMQRRISSEFDRYMMGV
jgi:hypothetical protein